MTCEIIYYSATDTTENIMKAFSKGLNGELVFSKIDMFSHKNAVRSDADLLVFASPVYCNSCGACAGFCSSRAINSRTLKIDAS